MLNTGLFAQTVSIAGQSLDFSTPLTTNPSLTAGGTCAYDDVVTVGLTNYDAIITIEAVNNALISNFDNTATTNGNTAANFSPKVLWTSAGSIDYSITFIQDGTSGSPVPVDLGDFYLTALDLDAIGPSGVYFDADGISEYSIGATSFLTYTTGGSGNAKFTNTSAGSNTNGSDGRSKATVGYTSANRIEFSIGSGSSGNKDYMLAGASPASWFPTTESNSDFPTLATYHSLSAFFTCDGEPSTAQAIVLEGRNLDAAISVVAPTGYEVSLDVTSGWNNSISISGDTLGTVDTTVYIRMDGNAPLASPADININTTGHPGATLSVTGTKGGSLAVSNFAGTNPSACGLSDGSITFNITNVSDGSYTVNYQGGSTTGTVAGGVVTLSNLDEGHYRDIVLTDGSGCTTAAGNHITLSDTIDFTISYAPTDKAFCTGLSTTFGVVATGATVTYQWRNFNANTWTSISGATNTTYTTGILTDTATYDVQVTSAAGCRWTAPQVIADVHALPAATLDATPASCPGTADGSIDLVLTAGKTPITYMWSNGAGTEDLTGITSGNYSVTMLDPIGCQGTASVAVSDSDGVAPTVYARNITVALDSLGMAGIAAADVDSASSDNCSLTLSINTTSYSCSDLGTDTVRLIGTDGLLTDTAFAVVTVVDTTAPVILCSNDTTIFTAVDTSGANFSWAAATLYDNCGVDSNWTTDTSGTWFPIGTHQIYTYAIDASGNGDSCFFTLTVADSIVPSFLSCVSDTTMYANASSCGANLTWTRPAADDNTDTLIYSATDTSGTFFAVGIDTVMLFVQDLSGNRDTCSFVVTVMDTIAPAWSGTLDTLTVQAGLDTCGIFTDSVNLTPPTIVEACGMDTLYHNAAAYYPLGSYDLYWYATDIHGNSDSILQRLVVVETVVPEIYCPADTLHFFAAADSTWTQVSWTGDSVYDNCGLDSSYFTLANGGYLPVGSFKIDYYAYDLSGNGDTCSFYIAVQDTTPPTFTGVLSDTTLYTSTDSCSAFYSWAAPVVNENSNNYTLNTNYATPSGTFAIGTDTVYYTVTDGVGLSDSIGFIITVVDQIGPALRPDSISLVLDSMGFASLTVAQVDTGSYDCSGIDSLWITQHSFVCTDIGSPVVWFHGVDSLGYHDSVQLNITVLPHPSGVIQSTLATTDVLCFGDSNGTATISATGGSLPYAYSWTTGDTTQGLTGLAAGTYNYHVSDTNGCVYQANFTIAAPAALSSSIVASNYNGFGVSSIGATDGSADLTMAGGTAPYSFNWNSGFATTEDLNNVGAGSYTVVATDSNGCTLIDSVLLSSPDSLAVDAQTITNNICQSDTNGAVYVSISGGISPYTISWIPAGATSDSLSGLNSGLYIVTVVDSSGTVVTDTAIVESLDEDCDGILNIDEGGIPGGGGGMADFDGDGLPNQRDTDSDGDGLSDGAEFDLDGDGVGFDDCDNDGAPNFLDVDECTLYPATVLTPNGDGLNDTWEIPGVLMYQGTTARLFNRSGILVYSSDNYQNDFDGTANVQTTLNTITGELPTGTYFYFVQLGGNGQELKGYLYINR